LFLYALGNPNLLLDVPVLFVAICFNVLCSSSYLKTCFSKHHEQTARSL